MRRWKLKNHISLYDSASSGYRAVVNLLFLLCVPFPIWLSYFSPFNHSMSLRCCPSWERTSNYELRPLLLPSRSLRYRMVAQVFTVSNYLGSYIFGGFHRFYGSNEEGEEIKRKKNSLRYFHLFCALENNSSIREVKFVYS